MTRRIAGAPASSSGKRPAAAAFSNELLRHAGSHWAFLVLGKVAGEHCRRPGRGRRISIIGTNLLEASPAPDVERHRLARALLVADVLAVISHLADHRSRTDRSIPSAWPLGVPRPRGPGVFATRSRKPCRHAAGRTVEQQASGSRRTAPPSRRGRSRRRCRPRPWPVVAGASSQRPRRMPSPRRKMRLFGEIFRRRPRPCRIPRDRRCQLAMTLSFASASRCDTGVISKRS